MSTTTRNAAPGGELCAANGKAVHRGVVEGRHCSPRDDVRAGAAPALRAARVLGGTARRRPARRRAPRLWTAGHPSSAQSQLFTPVSKPRRRASDTHSEQPKEARMTPSDKERTPHDRRRRHGQAQASRRSRTSCAGAPTRSPRTRSPRASSGTRSAVPRRQGAAAAEGEQRRRRRRPRRSPGRRLRRAVRKRHLHQLDQRAVGHRCAAHERAHGAGPPPARRPHAASCVMRPSRAPATRAPGQRAPRTPRSGRAVARSPGSPTVALSAACGGTTAKTRTTPAQASAEAPARRASLSGRRRRGRRRSTPNDSAGSPRARRTRPPWTRRRRDQRADAALQPRPGAGARDGVSQAEARSPGRRPRSARSRTRRA